MNLTKIEEVCTNLVQTNIKLAKEGIQPKSINLVGLHGIGKTSVAKQIAERSGMRYIQISLANITQEDLVGYPNVEYLLDDNTWVPKENLPVYTKEGKKVIISRTNYSLPEWLNFEDDTPVILNLDDSFRNPNLQNAVMDITLNHSYQTWKLPAGSTVFLTNNPNQDDYMVVELDPAQKDRFFTFNVDFDLLDFVKYLEGKVDGRCINFILKYPEIIVNNNNGITKIVNSPRSLKLFFDSIRYIDDYKDSKNLQLIKTLASGILEKETCNLLINFIEQGLDLLPPISMIYEDNFIELLREVCFDKEGNRKNDIVSIISMRIFTYLNDNREQPFFYSKENMEKLGKIMTSDILSKDNRVFVISKLLSVTDKFTENYVKTDYFNQALD